MTKTEAAFRFTAEKLFAEYDRLYFWTFTFTETMPDWYYSRTFGRFMDDLQRTYSRQIRGVRVIEPHETHGLHYHAILTTRIWIELVLRISKRYGIGHVSVRKCDSQTESINYLAKYLSKYHGSKFHAKISRWGTVGDFEGVKVKSIVKDSNFTRNFQRVQASWGRRKVSMRVIRAVGQLSALQGEIEPSRLAAVCELAGPGGCLVTADALFDEMEFQKERCPF